jgi:hypothetical protein
MRFRRKTKLFPGVYLNFSKTGISTTIGIPGASINLGKQGTFLNTGIPGTGIYDRKKIGSNNNDKNKHFIVPKIENIEYQENEEEIKSPLAETMTSDGLNELKQTLLECYDEREKLKFEINNTKSQLKTAQIFLVLSYILIIGLIIKWFKENRNNKKEQLSELNQQLDGCFVDIDMLLDSEFEQSFYNIQNSFKDLTSTNKIWDITSSNINDRASSRSAANSSISRRQVSFSFKNIEIIKSKFIPLNLQNANGGDLFIYPAFIAIVSEKKKFGLIDIRELDFDFSIQRFLEEEKIANDALIIDKTWAKVNKNGERDKRFKDNYEIPICKYGKMEFRSKSGLNEAYSFSDYEKSSDFSNKLNEYIRLLK